MDNWNDSFDSNMLLGLTSNTTITFVQSLIVLPNLIVITSD